MAPYIDHFFIFESGVAYSGLPKKRVLQTVINTYLPHLKHKITVITLPDGPEPFTPYPQDLLDYLQDPDNDNLLKEYVATSFKREKIQRTRMIEALKNLLLNEQEAIFYYSDIDEIPFAETILAAKTACSEHHEPIYALFDNYDFNLFNCLNHYLNVSFFIRGSAFLEALEKNGDDPEITRFAQNDLSKNATICGDKRLIFRNLKENRTETIKDIILPRDRRKFEQPEYYGAAGAHFSWFFPPENAVLKKLTTTNFNHHKANRNLYGMLNGGENFINGLLNRTVKLVFQHIAEKGLAPQTRNLPEAFISFGLRMAAQGLETQKDQSYHLYQRLVLPHREALIKMGVKFPDL